jgi:hypothetical protein
MAKMNPGEKKDDSDPRRRTFLLAEAERTKNVSISDCQNFLNFRDYKKYLNHI